MSMRSTYVACAITGTLTAIVAGATGLPDRLTGNLNSSVLYFIMLLILMFLVVAGVVWFKERRLPRKEFIRTALTGLGFAIATTGALMLVFYVVFNIVLGKGN